MFCFLSNKIHHLVLYRVSNERDATDRKSDRTQEINEKKRTEKLMVSEFQTFCTEDGEEELRVLLLCPLQSD